MAGENTLSGLAPEYVAQLVPGMLIVDSSPGTSPIPQSTTIEQIEPDGTIIMSNDASDAASSSTTRNYVFVGSQFTGQFKTDASDSSKLIATDPSFIANLAPGMLVSGPAGIPPGTKILSIAKDHTSITLTNAVPASASGQSYTFSGGSTDPFASKITTLWYAWAQYYSDLHNLPAVPYTSEVNPYKLSFDAADQKKADAFAGEVYTVMNALSQIPLVNNPLSNASQLVANVIGCNVGLIPQITKPVAAALTNQIISLMRGVVNYQDPSTVKDWYSPPGDSTAGARSMTPKQTSMSITSTLTYGLSKQT